MTKYILLFALALGGCSPGNACRGYGFSPGTTAYSQCLQAEVLAYQNRLAHRP